MTKQAEMVPEVATVLARYREEIATAWAEMINRQMPGSPLAERTLDQAHADSLQALDTINDLLQGLTASVAEMTEDVTKLSLFRLTRINCDVAELVEATLLFKEAALPFIWRAYPAGSDAAREAIAQMDACLRSLVGDLAKWYAAETSRHLREQQGRTAMMLEMAQTASSTLELDEVLRCVARGIATAAGSRHCLFYLVNEAQNQGIVWVEMDESSISTSGSVQGVYRRRASLANESLIRQALEQKEPVACYDAQTDPRADRDTARLMGLKSALAVPFVAKGRVFAVALVTTFDDYHAFTEEQVELAWGTANAVAPAIENARLHQQVEQLAVVEERTRLAREIHDNLAQALGTLRLKASATCELLSSNQVDGVRANLFDIKQLAGEAYTDVREEIFSLRTSVSSGSGFLPALQEYLAEYRMYYGLDVRLTVDDESAADFTSETGIQVMRIIQEALTNVRKHTGTDNAWVRFERGDGLICISVEDRGQGFDPTRAVGKARHYFGLQIMRERAESVGGSLELISRPGKGTRVVIRVPAVRVKDEGR
jgi:signal transduction histidine kinase